MEAAAGRSGGCPRELTDGRPPGYGGKAVLKLANALQVAAGVARAVLIMFAVAGVGAPTGTKGKEEAGWLLAPALPSSCASSLLRSAASQCGVCSAKPACSATGLC